jgi:ribosomal protein S18 acetylase RimI-like enzyme
MLQPVEIKSVSVSDAATLLQLSRKTFFDAFHHQNDAADMEAYASTAFTFNKIKSELSNPDSEFYFASVHGRTAGYIKFNYNAAQTDLQDSKSIEIERIYVLADYQGKQIGKQLINFAIEKAVDKKMDFIWLGVWEQNTNAIRFYEGNGFKRFSSHRFMLGNDEQTDILMSLTLSEKD